MTETEQLDIFKKSFGREWYTQAGSGTAIYIIASAYSGFNIMRDYLGFSYSQYLFETKDNYVEMRYLKKDLTDLWKIIKEKIIKNPLYLYEVKEKYDKTFLAHHTLFKQIESTDLKNLSDEKIQHLLNKIIEAQSDSVGLGHIIEPISLAGDSELRELLREEIQDQDNFNHYFSILTTPSKPSFILQEEFDLYEISRLPLSQQKKVLDEHQKKYFWIQNSYLGPQELSIDYFSERLKKIKPVKISNVNSDELIEKLNLGFEARNLIKIFDMITAWQDERKANVLQTISYFGLVLKEIGRRFYIKPSDLTLLTIKELHHIVNHPLKNLSAELEIRNKGACYFMDGNNELVLCGENYERFKRPDNEKMTGQNEIRGMIACGGSARGKVTLCRGLSDFDKVEIGDILVASMTRPEFMPVLRKVAGIVTDEGGITSHAAIVARELDIPAVIGTKIATKLLKDGDVVEVRANHGLVRILEGM